MKHKYQNFTIYIENDYESLSHTAAKIIAAQIKERPSGIFGFATGGTPVGTYKCLIEMNKANEIDFSQITTFNLDEYYPINKTNSQSYDFFMKENLFGYVNINHEKIHIPNGEAKDVASECENYECQIADAGGIDFQILGIGLNGHIGFNEPAETFQTFTHYVSLDTTTIEANSRFFESVAEVPKSAITMGIKTIMMSRRILLIINGAQKADIAYETVFGSITPRVPASVLQLHHDVTIVLDREAAEKMLPRI